MKDKSPIEERKPDLEVNGSKINEAIARQREREKHLFPLRIDKTTAIYVTKEKCNPEYAERYKREKLNAV